MTKRVASMTDAELVEAAGEGIGSAPAVRDRAAAELTRRLMSEMRRSSETIASYTRALIWLTVAIFVLTAVLVVAGIEAAKDPRSG